MGLFFEEFTPGREFVTGSRVVDDASIRAWADLSGDRNPLHLDEAYARETAFGGRIAPGVLGLAFATGLLSEAGFTRGTLVALVGVQWRFLVPVRPGDSVSLRLRVGEQRPREGRNHGVVRFEAWLTNQKGETVQEGEITELIRARPAPTG